jgi:alpha-D-ribose 1-methylphosphonate 5-triphosphate synthase subunit PhnL
MKIEIKCLSKEFFLHRWSRKIGGFSDISFSVEKEEFFGISGESGAGKSSLIKCIYRTYIPNKGEIWYESSNGQVNLTTLSEYEVLKLRKTEMGYVSQFLRVVPRVSAVDVVAEPLIKKGVQLDEARAEAASLLEMFLIPQKIFDAYPSTFSGGEKQRVNLARALITKFDLLLLDEPTASLDNDIKAIVIEMLREEMKRGTTMVCVSHDASFLNALADRVGVMKGGRMVEILEEVP